MARKKPEKAEGNICVVYARYSSAVQNDASIEQQVAECREYAAAHDLKISDIYADRAVSGRSDRRPEFQKMIRHAETGRFQIVLTYKSNRIARNMLDALRYEERLEKAGVRVVYCKENFGDNAAGRMALRMMMSLNEFYSENMAEDITRGMKDRAKQCKVMGTIPFGYITLANKHRQIMQSVLYYRHGYDTSFEGFSGNQEDHQGAGHSPA